MNCRMSQDSDATIEYGMKNDVDNPEEPPATTNRGETPPGTPERIPAPPRRRRRRCRRKRENV